MSPVESISDGINHSYSPVRFSLASEGMWGPSSGSVDEGDTDALRDECKRSNEGRW